LVGHLQNALLREYMPPNEPSFVSQLFNNAGAQVGGFPKPRLSEIDAVPVLLAVVAAPQIKPLHLVDVGCQFENQIGVFLTYVRFPWLQRLLHRGVVPGEGI